MVSIDEMKIIEMTADERGVFAQAAHGLVYDDPESSPSGRTSCLLNAGLMIRAKTRPLDDL
jgi:hypothetical protein